MERLQEAHAPADFHARVQALHQGETARLQGGVSVRREATVDGRDTYVVGRPSSYGRGEEPSYGERVRTAEEATRQAFAESGRSNDPESIGGATRLASYAGVTHGGQPVRITGWDLRGNALVRTDGGVSDTVVAPSALTGASLREELLEAPESLDRSPRKNWVEKRGGLPQAIVHMAKDIHEERGLPLAQAIPIAISQAKKLAAKGNAKYAAAVAQWEKMKAQEAEDSPFGAPLEEAAYSDASRVAALAARKAKHPDWHWHDGSAPAGTSPTTRDAGGFVHPAEQDRILKGELMTHRKMGYDQARHNEAASNIERGPATLGPRRTRYQPTAAEQRKVASHRLGAAHASGSGVAMRSAVNRHGSDRLKKRLRERGVNLDLGYRHLPD